MVATYERRKAELVGIDDLIHAFYDKDERGGDGRYLVAHLADEHRPHVCVDDQPEGAACRGRRGRRKTILAHNPHDLGLAPVLERIAS